MTINPMDEVLEALVRGDAVPFSAWPDQSVPHIAAGAYTIWHGETLIYVGMSGQGGGASENAVSQALERGRPWGLWTRLTSHASGRCSGDQFCVYVGDRLVLPTLTASDLQNVSNGSLSFDSLVRNYIREHLEFRFAITTSGREALEAERAIKSGALGCLPLLNPS